MSEVILKMIVAYGILSHFAEFAYLNIFSFEVSFLSRKTKTSRKFKNMKFFRNFQVNWWNKDGDFKEWVDNVNMTSVEKLR